MIRSRALSHHDSPPTYHVRAAHAIPYHQLGRPKIQFTNNTPQLDIPRANVHKKSRNDTGGSGTSTESGPSSLIPSLSRSRPASSFGLDDQLERPQPFGDKTTNYSTPHPMRHNEQASVC